MTKDEALKLALEYIETNAHERRHVRWAIKEALAQPVQEPLLVKRTRELVEWLDACGINGEPLNNLNYAIAMLTTPPLPVQERNFCQRCGKRTADLTTIHTCTPPQTIADEHIAKVTSDIDLAVNKALAQPERPWVGLTEEEIHASKPPISNDAVVWELAVEWAEAKLKEKNT